MARLRRCRSALDASRDVRCAFPRMRSGCFDWRSGQPHGHRDFLADRSGRSAVQDGFLADRSGRSALQSGSFGEESGWLAKRNGPRR